MSDQPATKADVENLVTLLQQHFERSDQRFDGIVTRFDGVDTRLDRVNDTLVGVQTQMAGMTRWSDRFDREHATLLQTQAAQQRAIDELGARVKQLEQRKAS
jgi:hypothetical protein